MLFRASLFRSARVAGAAARRAWCSSGVAAARVPLTAPDADEAELREAVRRFAQAEIEPKVREMDEKQQMDPDVIRGCFEQGFMGIETPEALGGAGLSFTASCVVIEELAKVDPAVSVMVDVQNTLLNTAIKKWGSTLLQEKYLPRLATDTVGSFCLSEAGSGSDAFAMKTRADDVGDHYVINGTKLWITNAKEANAFLVMANVDPSVGYKGITAFLVDGDNPGIRVGKKEDKLGIRASSTCEVIFDSCKVPKDHVVGEIGKGYKYAIEALNEGRIGIGAQMLGLAQGVFDRTMPYVIERKQFGQSISDFQGVQFNYASLAMELEAARLLVYNAAALKESGKPFVKEAAFAKLYASNVAEKCSSMCIELAGGVGFTKEFPIEKYYRDCKVGKIYEGTSNIQLQTIGKLVQKEYS